MPKLRSPKESPKSTVGKTRLLGPNDNQPIIGRMFTLGPNGELPSSKIPYASLLWDIAEQLKRDDSKRAIKRSRVYKQYKRFAPTDYSVVFKRGATWQSNVCWGQLKFIIDSQKSVFYDMASESPEIAEITTKFGTLEQQLEYSQKISAAWDKAIRSWPGYLINAEQDIEELLLYGKGIQFWPKKEGFFSKNISNNDIMFPEGTRFDMTNCEVVVLRWEFSPNELYAAVKDQSEDSNWNWNAVIDAIRYNVTPSNLRKTREDWLHSVAAGDINLTSCINQKIPVYIGYWKEFDGPITKGIVLQNYDGILNGLSTQRGGDLDKTTLQKQVGFLYSKQNHAEDWDDLFAIVNDSVGSGKMHEIQSQAEQAFIACRQYDITMNRIMDAIFINMMMLLTGNNPDANKRIREMDFLPMMVLPDGVLPQQVKLDIPTTESLQVLTYMMRDTYSGMATYKSNEPTNGGRQRTKGEAELDAANDSQVTGTQAKRVNEGRTNYFRQLYKRFVDTGKGEEGYEYVEMFYDLLEQWGVPKEAADWKNILSVKSVMVAGAGSPSMKIIMGEKLIELTGMSAANPGQERAIRQTIGFAGGVGNVENFRPSVKTPNVPLMRIISDENANMSIVDPNPENFQVAPSDPHMEHIAGHYSDMMFDTSNLTQMFTASGQQPQNPDGDQQPGTSPQEMMAIVNRLKVKGGHVFAHLKFVSMDESKKDYVQQVSNNMEKIQQALDQMEPQILKKMGEKPDQGVNMDPQLQLQIAMKQVEVAALQQKENVKLAAKASMAQLQEEIKKNQGATNIAISRAKADEDIRQKKVGFKKPPAE